MNVAIFTEGSSTIGLGHVSRCQSLMQAFEHFGCEVQMYVKGDESVPAFTGTNSVLLLDWAETNALLPEGFDIAVIDSYLADISVYERLAESVKVLLCLDDYNRLDYPEGFVLNSALAAEELDYPLQDGKHYLLGAKYALMRKPFWQAGKKKIREQVSDILVTFGGEDVRNLTPKALEVCLKVFPQARIHAIIGQAMKPLAMEYSNLQKHTALDATGMKALMEQCDLWIGAGGMTLFELAAIGVPGVAIQVAENQQSNLKGFEDAGFLDAWLSYADVELEKKLADKLTLLAAVEKREALSHAGQKAIDGEGAMNVAKAVLDSLKRETL